MPILNWLSREKDLKTSRIAPYRLLEAAPELSYGKAETDNMVIQGDNLEALKALLPYSMPGQSSASTLTRRTTPKAPLNTMTTTWSTASGWR